MVVRKAVLASLLAAAFFVGTFFTAFSIADATKGGNNAWAKLVARVTELEHQLDGNSLKLVHLEDDDAGHAVGWDPGDFATFTITDGSVRSDSVVNVTVDDNNNIVPCDVVDLVPASGFTLSCVEFGSGLIVQNGAVLNYEIINPQ